MKLGEAIEWIERNYDEYELYFTDVGDGLRMSYWMPPEESDIDRYELGRGSSHRAPMFNFRNTGSVPGDCYTWEARQDFIPLSRESEAAPL